MKLKTLFFLLLLIVSGLITTACGGGDDDDDDSKPTLASEINRLRSGMDAEVKRIEDWLCDCMVELGSDDPCPTIDPSGELPMPSEITKCDEDVYDRFHQEISGSYNCFIDVFVNARETLEALQCVELLSGDNPLDSMVDEVNECKRVSRDSMEQWVTDNGKEDCVKIFEVH